MPRRILLVALASFLAAPADAWWWTKDKSKTKTEDKSTRIKAETKKELENLGRIGADAAENVGETLKGAAEAIGDKVKPAKKKKDKKKR